MSRLLSLSHLLGSLGRGAVVVAVTASIAATSRSSETSAIVAVASEAGHEEHAASHDASANDTGSQATHKQSKLIQLNPQGSAQGNATCFCLNGDAELLAGCTGSANVIRVFNPDGAMVREISLPVAPEAINLDADGMILVAGDGELLRLRADGEIVTQVEAPHVAQLAESRSMVRDEVLKQREQQKQMLPMMEQSYDRAMEQLDKQIETIVSRQGEVRQQVADAMIDERLARESGDERAAAQSAAVIRKVAKSQTRDVKRLETLRSTRESYENALAQLREQFGPAQDDELSEEQLERLIDSAIKSKQTVASISGAGDAVFVACRSIEGYGYDVWRVSADLASGEQIVSGLSGCCGQMD
ncbi:MAG: hypothetical protein KDA61_04865, partial [Planctomycetales bacterium]|nr:hypothetical protein [Planctomycetales bacterium]